MQSEQNNRRTPVIVPCSAGVLDLGVLLDSKLSIRQHISKVASTCYYHLRRLCLLRSYVSGELVIQRVTSLAMSHIDYCNSLLVGLPSSAMSPLQWVQNAAVWLILGLSRQPHITSATQ